MAEAVAATGRIDVLVNTAGLWVEGPTEDMTEADWDRVVDVNLKGTFFACSSAIPELKKTAGLHHQPELRRRASWARRRRPSTRRPRAASACMTKALAIELAPHLVRVNAVCPADIMTPMLQYQADTYGGGDPEGYFKRLLASYFQGDKARFITPEEVAELIFFLASAPAAPITGANISIDFGTSAGYGYA